MVVNTLLSSHAVIPAKAGIQRSHRERMPAPQALDPRLRGDDDKREIPAVMHRMQCMAPG
ncbi:MAG: hypothetical protein EPN97_01375 [Alphaproteobacteria bacterium]|nr:MAG: hypothetical protein EPN97_01375 [Alphaproteobacteria bacterium]